jgi:hypothetical protein
MKRLALFARRPVPGRVKTRLIPALTARLACRLHQAMLADAIAVLEAAAADERWLYWADSSLDAAAGAADAALVLPLGVREGVQSGADLGERLERAFSELLAGGSQAVVFGSDCPWLGVEHIERAFGALERADLVVGPASDGGYTLIGLRAPQPELFRGIDWGSPRVLEQTLAHARERGLTVERLETLDDVDTAENLVRAIERLFEALVARESPTESLATNLRRALKQIGLLPTSSTVRPS